jgi:hypothetical protein
MGPGGARTLRRALAAWGPGSRQRLAARVGVAPGNRASGTLRGPRTTWGGRTHVRAPLSMRALVAGRDQPGRTAFSPRLCPAGNAKKVARTAGRRTLLTMLKAMAKPQQSWPVQEVPSAEQTRPLDNQDSCSGSRRRQGPAWQWPPETRSAPGQSRPRPGSGFSPVH